MSCFLRPVGHEALQALSLAYLPEQRAGLIDRCLECLGVSLSMLIGEMSFKLESRTLSIKN